MAELKPSPAYIQKNGKLYINGSSKQRALGEYFSEGYLIPTYFYNLDDIENRVNALRMAFNNNIEIHYAMKANDHHFLLQFFHQLGIGFDVVSGGELEKASAAKAQGEEIVFSGVGKTKKEILKALDLQISQINIESPAELRRVGSLAKSKGVKARVAFRLNPDVNPETHPYIKTGFRENKFGMDVSFFKELREILLEYKESLQLVGVTMHIGSQLRELNAIFEAVEKTLRIFDQWNNEGFLLETFDIGGGVGIDYHSLDPEHEFDLIKKYGQGVLERVGQRSLKLMCEPGRILVGRSGVLISEVQYIKETPYKKFCIVDTGMHHLMRPSLYQAFHQILPLQMAKSEVQRVYDVVGPICESADVLGFDRQLPEIKEGDLLAVMDTGAYGAVMSSAYNSHPQVNEKFLRDCEVVYENN